MLRSVPCLEGLEEASCLPQGTVEQEVGSHKTQNGPALFNFQTSRATENKCLWFVRHSSHETQSEALFWKESEDSAIELRSQSRSSGRGMTVLTVTFHRLAEVCRIHQSGDGWREGCHLPLQGQEGLLWRVSHCSGGTNTRWR